MTESIHAFNTVQHYKAPYHRHWYEHKLELLLKQSASQSFGLLQYRHIENLMPINLILQLKIITATPAYWFS